jgi:putative membrane protein
MKMRPLLISMAAVSVVLALPALAAENAQDFVDKAAVGGKFEVACKLALDKAQNQAVKDFAQKMIRDYGDANAKLESIAGEQKLKVPTTLDASHKSDPDKLGNGRPPIDSAYVDMQRKAHDDAVELLEDYARDGDNATLKAFDQQTVGTLKMHQRMIEKISASKESSTGATTPAVNTSNSASAAALVPGANSLPRPRPRAALRRRTIPTCRSSPRTIRAFHRGRLSAGGRDLPLPGCCVPPRRFEATES